MFRKVRRIFEPNVLFIKPPKLCPPQFKNPIRPTLVIFKAAAVEILTECIVDYGTNLLDRMLTGNIIC